jgi:hypothetical protein
VHLLHVLHELSLACSVEHRQVKIESEKKKRRICQERERTGPHILAVDVRVNISCDLHTCVSFICV